MERGTVILLDTDVLIAHLRGQPKARRFFDAVPDDVTLAVSVVTLTETSGGMRTGERRQVAGLLNALRPEPVTELIAVRAGQLMRQHRAANQGIGIADYLIAATAKQIGASLATLNVRHFPMFEGLEPAF